MPPISIKWLVHENSATVGKTADASTPRRDTVDAHSQPAGARHHEPLPRQPFCRCHASSSVGLSIRDVGAPTAQALARQGRLAILRHGKPVDPDGFKGVYRLRLP